LIFRANSRGLFQAGDRLFSCAIGRGGLAPAADKREGDGASPIGVWALRRLLYRPDRGPAPQTALPSQAITRQDGWCDDPDHPAYNRLIELPFAASHEVLWRDDGLYDLVVVLGHNDDPPVAPLGSAIFLHLAKPDYAPTEGCIALARPDLEAVLALARPGDALEIGPD
jgi:L,D-peptidoglycan transpeptidase YkuD (ErfK/YbiS/YcfS/YnhG family)|tara:strand:+ start:36483 stop:36989 length:507 start_codon:yes stop_codon:yes gene_type:complete